MALPLPFAGAEYQGNGCFPVAEPIVEGEGGCAGRVDGKSRERAVVDVEGPPPPRLVHHIGMREPQSTGGECRWGNHPAEKSDRDNNAGHRRDASDALSPGQPALLADPAGP